MAGVQLVLSDPLCVLVNKFGKEQQKSLKTSLIDFYSCDDLLAAKQQLLQDINKVNVTGFALPHIPHQRQGENRAARSVDDMFTLMTILDENKALDILPKYVASGPDTMPSTRLYEGDFGVLLATIKRMSDRLDTFGSALSTISRDVYALQAKAKATVVNTRSTGGLNLDNLQVWPGLPAQPVADATRVDADMTSRGNSVVNAVPAKASDFATTTTTTAANDVTGDFVNRPSERTETQWAILASTPQSSSNRYAALASIDADENNDSDRPFVSSRAQKRSAAKRYRQMSDIHTNRQPGQSDHQPERQPLQLNRQSDRQRKQVIGQSSAVSLSIWAAKRTVKKAVFCVDNISLGCNVDDLRRFVSALGVEVFTCYKTKPRRRPDETADDVADRNAFRLCINAADRDCLLNADQWPDSVRISDWFFRGKNTEQDNGTTDQGNNDKRRRVKSPDRPGGVEASLAVAGGGGVTQQHSTVDDGSGQPKSTSSEFSTGRVSADVEEVMDAVNTERDVDQDNSFTEDDSVECVDKTAIYQYG